MQWLRFLFFCNHEPFFYLPAHRNTPPFDLVLMLVLVLVLVLVLTCFQRAGAQAPTDSVDLFLYAKMRQLRIPGLQLAVAR